MSRGDFGGRSGTPLVDVVGGSASGLGRRGGGGHGLRTSGWSSEQDPARIQLYRKI